MTLISIILPTYNSIKFLKERVDTILDQNYTHWECLVIDGFSTDGTWEYLLEIALNDSRFKNYQFEPKGVYNAWNKGLGLVKGGFIYFATSDDTMTPDCLEKMMLALENNSSCSIAHCNLKIINMQSEREASLDWYTFPAGQYFKDKIYEHHIRKAPLCGLLYFTHQTIIHSFTQVLIRKEVFDTIGCFLEDQGPEADLEWGMRATLSEDIVHIPHELATWRLHSKQLTILKVNESGMKHIRSLQLKAVENAKIDDALKRHLLENSDLLQAISIKQQLQNYTRFQKLSSTSYWQLKMLIAKHPEIKDVLNNRNEYFEFVFKTFIHKKTNTYIFDNEKS